MPKLEIVKELLGQLELVQIGKISAAAENDDPTAVLEIEGNGQLIHFDFLLKVDVEVGPRGQFVVVS